MKARGDGSIGSSWWWLSSSVKPYHLPPLVLVYALSELVRRSCQKTRNFNDRSRVGRPPRRTDQKPRGLSHVIVRAIACPVYLLYDSVGAINRSRFIGTQSITASSKSCTIRSAFIMSKVYSRVNRQHSRSSILSASSSQFTATPWNRAITRSRNRWNYRGIE